MPKTNRAARANVTGETNATNTTNTTNTTSAANTTERKAAWQMPDWQRILVLVVGDFLVFMIFATIGSRSHDVAANLWQTFLIALPFALGWFIVAPFLGVYRRNLMSDPRKMAGRTALAWLLSWPLAMALRGIFVDHAVPPVTFAIIALVSNLIILEVWRWPYALNNSMRSRDKL